MGRDILISEVGPRDGLQSIKSIMPLPAKKAWISALAASGLREIEVGSFVPAQVLPQLADTAEVVAHALTIPNLTVAVLVPNLRGAEDAIRSGVHKLTIPFSASETHSLKNVRRSHAQMFDEVRRIAERLRWQPAASRPKLEGGLSTAFGCTYEGDVPIDSGAVQLFRDDAFVGLGELPMVLPGADVRIPFGQDQRIRIVVRDESEESGNVGVVNRDQLNERRRRFEITSFHASALPIEVIDRVPVARDEDIRIEVLKGATPPASKDFNGHAGVYLWRLAGEPRKTETIRHYYSVKFPRNKALAQVEGG